MALKTLRRAVLFQECFATRRVAVKSQYAGRNDDCPQFLWTLSLGHKTLEEVMDRPSGIGNSLPNSRLFESGSESAGIDPMKNGQRSARGFEVAVNIGAIGRGYFRF